MSPAVDGWRLMVLVFPLLAACSCSGARALRGPGATPLLATAVGPVLEGSWKASGGLEEWRRIGAVRFTYRARPGPAARLLPGALPRASDPSPGASRDVGPLAVSFVPGRWDRIEVEEAGGARSAIDLRGEPDAGLADYALRSARVFFQLPFALSEPGWEFRVWQAGGIEPDPWTFIAVPAGAAVPHRALRVRIDPATGLPLAAEYEVEHPAAAGRVFTASFGGWRRIGGVLIPSEIVHRGWPGEISSGRYPWEAPAAGGEGSAGDDIFLVEAISDVHLTEKGAEPAEGAAP